MPYTGNFYTLNYLTPHLSHVIDFDLFLLTDKTFTSNNMSKTLINCENS